VGGDENQRDETAPRPQQSGVRNLLGGTRLEIAGMVMAGIVLAPTFESRELDKRAAPIYTCHEMNEIPPLVGSESPHLKLRLPKLTCDV
jgi:hypothetical protein